MNEAAPRSEPPWSTSPKYSPPHTIAVEKSPALAAPHGRRRIDKEELQGPGPASRPFGCLGPLLHFQRERCNTEANQCASLCPLARASLVYEAGASAHQYSFESPLWMGCELI